MEAPADKQVPEPNPVIEDQVCDLIINLRDPAKREKALYELRYDYHLYFMFLESCELKDVVTSYRVQLCTECSFFFFFLS